MTGKEGELTVSLSNKLQTLNNPALPQLKTGSDDTIAEFWDDFVAPLLPPKQAVIGMYQLLLRYVEDEDPRITYVIRNFANTQGGKKNYITLRRGFLTKTDSYSYFFTDNFFAAYFYKMALDGYVPDYNEFKEAMISREFPARFGPFDSEFERPKAAYSIDGKKGKNPGFTDAGYKISHIIDSGDGYLIDGKTMSVTDWCDKYGFDRGDYADYVQNTDTYGSFCARIKSDAQPTARDVLKAQFLRLACPLNHVLTPKVGKNRCHVLGQGVQAKQNDIGEMAEFQQYAMEQMKIIYGSVYDDYLSRLMLAAPSVPPVANPGATYIGIRYGYKIGAKAKANKTSAQPKTTTRSGSSGVGATISAIFADLLRKHKLSQQQIDNLCDKAYCSKNLGISFAILAKPADLAPDQKKRYYTSLGEIEGYFICSQWKEKLHHPARVDAWLENNSLK